MEKKDNKTKLEDALISRMQPEYEASLMIGTKKIIGRKEYLILRTIGRTHSLKETSRLLNISYRSCQDKIKRMDTTLGISTVVTERGGTGAGGKAELTEFGVKIVKKYDTIKANITAGK